MIPWLWILPAFIAGSLTGMVLAFLIAAGGDDR